MRRMLEGTPLSNRERQILLLVAEGHSNDQIGRALGISEWTVHEFLVRANIRLGATDRTDAVIKAFKRGDLELIVDQPQYTHGEQLVLYRLAQAVNGYERLGRGDLDRFEAVVTEAVGILLDGVREREKAN
jgi:DNA-binding CsgD family transcriptional regulator